MTIELQSAHRPAGPDLLRVARETFEAVLLPALTDEHRYTALMVGHALAICEREWCVAAVDAAGADLSNAARQHDAMREAMAETGLPDEAVWAELWQGVRARLLVDKGEDRNTAS